jgi:hypothetical protein
MIYRMSPLDLLDSLRARPEWYRRRFVLVATVLLWVLIIGAWLSFTNFRGALSEEDVPKPLDALSKTFSSVRGTVSERFRELNTMISADTFFQIASDTSDTSEALPLASPTEIVSTLTSTNPTLSGSSTEVLQIEWSGAADGRVSR